MALSIYMDESNTHDGTEYLTVSTAWAKPQVWADWAVEWAQKISPLKIYHAVDVHNRIASCAGWTPEERDAMVIRSLPTFPKYKIHGAVACLNRKKLAQGLARRPGIMNEIKHEYLIAFIFAVSNAMKLGGDALNFFHEENDWCDRAHYHFNKLKERYNRSNAVLSFGAKDSWPPLQCADLFAYEGYQQLKLDPTFKKITRPWQAINIARDKLLVSGLVADDKVTALLCDALIDWFDKGAQGGVSSAYGR